MGFRGKFSDQVARRNEDSPKLHRNYLVSLLLIGLVLLIVKTCSLKK